MRSYYELPDEEQAELSLGLVKGQNLNQVLSLNLPSSFVFKMGSHRNRALGINKGDFVVVRRDIIPESGQLVLVKAQGKFVLRTYVFPGTHEPKPRPESQPEAQPRAESKSGADLGHGASPRDADLSAGRHYVTYLPNGTPEFELFGVVTAIFRKLGRAAPSPDEPVPGSLKIPRGNP